ncbi:MAG: hypothetical protein JSW41_00985 [Candidatus Aenigmatarchaeota archaeon]|nr:MAG: hypothetical protein JSW41_00985 [Candidatus Aenigmarchaeota archaeon]
MQWKYINMGQGMKGQMVFEFVIAAVIFFGIVFYTVNYLSSSFSSFSNDLYMNDLESKVIQVSDLLVHNQGLWENGKPKIIGLSKEWPVLDAAKIQDFEDFCNDPANYTYLLENLGLDEIKFGVVQTHRIKIKIDDDSGTLVDCGPSPPEKQMVSIERFALSEYNDILRINVWIW